MNNHNLLPFRMSFGSSTSDPFNPAAPPHPIVQAVALIGQAPASGNAQADVRAGQQGAAADDRCGDIAACYRDAIEAFGTATDNRRAAESADACMRLGHCLVVAGDLDGALVRFETGLQTYRALGDIDAELATLQALAGIHRAQGRYPNVMALLRDFLPLVPAAASDAQRDFFVAGIAEGRCADVRAAQGRTAHAARWLNRSWRRWARLGRHREQTVALDRLSDAQAALGHHVAALHTGKAARCLENDEHVRQARLGSVLVAIERDAERCHDAERCRQIGQDELAHLTRLADLGRMVTCIAHEMTQPLAAIRLVAENAAADDTRGLQPSRSQKGLAHVVQLVDQLTVYVEQLKRFTRRDAVQVDPVQLSTIVAEALAIVEPKRKSRNVTLSFALDDLEVLADATRASGILVNLLCNAFDAVAGAPCPSVLLMSRVAGDRAVLEVRDHGGGLSDHTLAHLFEPFHTTKPLGRGTGLGLSLAMDLSTSMGANLAGANHPDGGALFTLDMPLAPAMSAGRNGRQAGATGPCPNASGANHPVADSPRSARSVDGRLTHTF